MEAIEHHSRFGGVSALQPEFRASVTGMKTVSQTEQVRLLAVCRLQLSSASSSQFSCTLEMVRPIMSFKLLPFRSSSQAWRSSRTLPLLRSHHATVTTHTSRASVLVRQQSTPLTHGNVGHNRLHSTASQPDISTLVQRLQKYGLSLIHI